ncbi:hypothetical protein P4133_30800 [Pseudomonas aeruginosa]|nr:hypothetical protein [Pseudomonas aeruginosa]
MHSVEKGWVYNVRVNIWNIVPVANSSLVLEPAADGGGVGLAELLKARFAKLATDAALS